MNIGFIGSGSFSSFHIQAINKFGFKIEAIGSRPKSKRCFELAKKNNLENVFCPEGWKQVLNKEVDAFIVCVNISTASVILNEILNTGKPIFIEKPIGWHFSKIESLIKHKNIKNVFVGYNRRYYETIQRLKNDCEIAKGGTVSVNFPDSISGIKKFVSNGSHVIDAMRFVLGDFSVYSNLIRENSENSDIDSVSALCQNSKWQILFNAHSRIPANLSISVNTGNSVYELKPIEKYTHYDGFEIIEPNEDNPLRRYNPRIKNTFLENIILKPGFENMYKNFELFVKGDFSANLCDFKDAYLTLKTCWEIIDSKVSREFLQNNF